MEELRTREEMAKGFLYELLRDAGLVQLYNEGEIESYFLEPLNNTANAYKSALTIFDNLVTK